MLAPPTPPPLRQQYTAKRLVVPRRTITNPKYARTKRVMAEDQDSLLSAIPWNSASLADGSFRRRVAQVAGLGHRRMHLWLPGDENENAQAGISPSIIHALGVLYDTLSQIDPRMLVVPMLACGGWNQESALSIPGINTVALSADVPLPPSIAASQSSTDPQGQPAAAGPRLITLPPLSHDTNEQEMVLPPEIIPPPALSDVSAFKANEGPARGQGVDHRGPQAGKPLTFDHVAAGGTFDRLHCGHELLLASTALLACQTVYVGITADKLLANKNHRELLQPYDQRNNAAVQFMQAVRPGLRVESGALVDPNEPTQAELDPAMQAIVVSQETLPGAVRINEGRAARGFAPLLVLVVPVIGCRTPGHKLSSTQLRALDAAGLAGR